MIELIGRPLYQWDTGREVNGFTGNAAQFANKGDSQAMTIEVKDGSCRIPDRYLMSGSPVLVYDVELSADGKVATTNSVTVFAVKAKPKPKDYVPTAAEEAYGVVKKLLDEAKAAAGMASSLAQDAAGYAEDAYHEAIKAKASADSAKETAAQVDSNLNDIKNGYDGTVYDTAGEAIRGQVSDINKAFDIKKIRGNNLLNIANQESGTFSSVSAGNEMKKSASNVRLRTINPIPVRPGIKKLYISSNIDIPKDEKTSPPSIRVWYLDENQMYRASASATFKKIRENGVHEITVNSSDGTSLYTCHYICVDFSGIPSNDEEGRTFENICISQDPISSFEPYQEYESRTLEKSCLPDLDIEHPFLPIDFNFFDCTKVSSGVMAYPSGSANGIKSDPGSLASDYIPAEPGTVLCISNVPTYLMSEYSGSTNRNICAYKYDKDSAKYEYVKLVGYLPVMRDKMSYIVPDGATHIRFSIAQGIDVETPAGEELFNQIVDETAGGKITVTLNGHSTPRGYINPLNIKKAPLRTSPAKGAKMLLFGDSATETSNMTVDSDEVVTDYNPYYRINWPSFMKVLLQVGSIRNYALHGATARDKGNKNHRMSLAGQINIALKDGNDDVDIVVVAIGTNDTGDIIRGVGIDEYEDAFYDADGKDIPLEALENDRSTMHKALRWSLETLRNKYPGAKCFYGTPIQRHSPDIPQFTRDAIKAMSARYGFKLIDAYAESGIVGDNERGNSPLWGFAGYAKTINFSASPHSKDMVEVNVTFLGDGKYYLSALINGVRKYITLRHDANENKVVPELTDTAINVYTFNSEIKTLVTDVETPTGVKSYTMAQLTNAFTINSATAGSASNFCQIYTDDGTVVDAENQLNPGMSYRLGFHPNDKDYPKGYYLYDGLHPTPDGSYRLASLYAFGIASTYPEHASSFAPYTYLEVK